MFASLPLRAPPPPPPPPAEALENRAARGRIPVLEYNQKSVGVDMLTVVPGESNKRACLFCCSLCGGGGDCKLVALIQNRFRASFPQRLGCMRAAYERKAQPPAFKSSIPLLPPPIAPSPLQLPICPPRSRYIFSRRRVCR